MSTYSPNNIHQILNRLNFNSEVFNERIRPLNLTINNEIIDRALRQLQEQPLMNFNLEHYHFFIPQAIENENSVFNYLPTFVQRIISIVNRTFQMLEL